MEKLPSILEEHAYRDTWGRGRGSYLSMLYERLVLMHELLATDGSLFVHLDWHQAHYVKVMLDEIFGDDRFLNEIVWWYYNKFQDNVNRFASNHDVIFWYAKSESYTFHRQREAREKPIQQIRRVWDKEKQSIVNAKDPVTGKVLYDESTERTIDDVWRLSMLQPADKVENVRYQTQKPLTVAQRVISASTDPGDLVADFFCGSGTALVAAERLGRRWIGCDLGRFAIHTTRKRLLNVPDLRPHGNPRCGVRLFRVTAARAASATVTRTPARGSGTLGHRVRVRASPAHAAERRCAAIAADGSRLGG